MLDDMPEQVDRIISKMTGTESVPVEGDRGSDLLIGPQFYCDARGQNSLNEFIDSEKPKLVALVGFAGYGKSTFIGSLYQLLIQNQEYEGYSFIDSDTYVGFERRVFLRRVNDGNISGTKRNILGESDLLNIMLKSTKGSVHQVLISDKAGETYQRYLSSNDDIKKDVVLEKADMLVFFIDADADSQGLPKHNLISDNYRSLLTRLSEQGKVCESTNYILVFTKVDRVCSEERKTKLTVRKAGIIDLFKERIGKEAEAVYEVNSTDLSDTALNDVFIKLICPMEEVGVAKELDWVKMEIEKA